MAEFVTQSIDNLSHGLTVQDAMKKLGLKRQACPPVATYFMPDAYFVSSKDLLPGLEVRLLPHQVRRLSGSHLIFVNDFHLKGNRRLLACFLLNLLISSTQMNDRMLAREKESKDRGGILADDM